MQKRTKLCRLQKVREETTIKAKNLKILHTNASEDLSKLKIILLNARSIADNLNFLHNFVIADNSSTFDLIFISETWLSHVISDSMVCPDQYNIYRSDRLNSRKGSVLVLFKSHLHVSHFKLSTSCDGIESINNC